jgi:hypothetical protein
LIYLLGTNAISDLMRGAPRIENWMAGLDASDRVVTYPIVRGEVLFGIARLPGAEVAQSWRRRVTSSRLHSPIGRQGDSALVGRATSPHRRFRRVNRFVLFTQFDRQSVRIIEQ